MPPDLAAALLILTAGRSARMGEPKALLRFGNRTALEIAVRNAIDAGIKRVVGVVGYRAEEIRAAHSFTGLPLKFEWAQNLDTASPQIVSLQAGLRLLSRTPIEVFLFQPVDLPLITAADMTHLLNAFRDRKSGERAAIPTCDGRRGHPVLCDAALIDAFLRLPPEYSARDLLEKVPKIFVETGNPGVVDDMDTKEDYKRLRDLFNSRERFRDRGHPGITPGDLLAAPDPGPIPDRS